MNATNDGDYTCAACEFGHHEYPAPEGGCGCRCHGGGAEQQREVAAWVN
jgi:hypothetical protein